MPENARLASKTRWGGERLKRGYRGQFAVACIGWGGSGGVAAAALSRAKENMNTYDDKGSCAQQMIHYTDRTWGYLSGHTASWGRR